MRPEQFERESKTTFKEIALDFLTAVTAELDPYTTEKGVIEVGPDLATLFTPSHIQFAKYGRGPGKMPPVNEIKEWVSKKRFQFKDNRGRFLSYESTAWAIAKHIAKYGSDNWVPNAPNALQEAFEKHVGKYSEDLNRELFGFAEIAIDEVINKNYPRKSSFKI